VPLAGLANPTFENGSQNKIKKFVGPFRNVYELGRGEMLGRNMLGAQASSPAHEREARTSDWNYSTIWVRGHSFFPI